VVSGGRQAETFEAVKSELGLSNTRIDAVIESLHAPKSLTNLIVKLPPAAKTLIGLIVLEKVPSPKSQCAADGFGCDRLISWKGCPAHITEGDEKSAVTVPIVMA
jgi:hypothetical protein